MSPGLWASVVFVVMQVWMASSCRDPWSFICSWIKFKAIIVLHYAMICTHCCRGDIVPSFKSLLRYNLANLFLSQKVTILHFVCEQEFSWAVFAAGSPAKSFEFACAAARQVTLKIWSWLNFLKLFPSTAHITHWQLLKHLYLSEDSLWHRAITFYSSKYQPTRYMWLHLWMKSSPCKNDFISRNLHIMQHHYWKAGNPLHLVRRERWCAQMRS